MKKYFSLVFMFVAFNTSSQTPLWQWLNIAGGGGNIYTNGYLESVRQMGTDAFGNIYAISSISSFGPTIDTVYKQHGFAYDDFVVFSYRCDGSFRWARFFGSSNNDRPGGLVVSPNGDVFICGNVIVGQYSDAHFGDTIIYQNSSYSKSSFIAKLDSSGHTQWLNLPGPNFSQLFSLFFNMVIDNQGNPVVIAWFQDSATWNGFHFPKQGHYLITFNPNNGAMIKVIKVDLECGYHYQDLFQITFAQDNSLYLSFENYGTVILGQDTVIRPVQSPTYLQSILVKFDSTGQKIWHQAVGGTWGSASNPPANPSYQLLTGKPLVHNNMIYIAGETQSYAGSSFLGTPVQNPIAYSGSLRTKVIARFNKHTGAFVGATNFWHNNVISTPSLLAFNHKIYAAMGGGRLVIFNQTDTLQPNTGDYRSHPFVIELDTALSHINWSTGAEVLMNNVLPNITSALIDNNGNIILGGDINGPVVSSLGDTSQIIGGNTDFFIAKVATTNTNCGCKPADPKPQMVSLYNKVLTVNGTTTIGADSLAWLWGDGTSTPYTQPGTTVSHTYAQGGNYTVCLRAWNICGVSDSCFQVLNVGVNELVIQNPELVIYPNPFSDALNIELPENMTDAQIALYDLVGKQVLNMNVTGNHQPQTLTLDTSTLEPGIYVIHLVSKHGGRFVGKVVRR
jgi:hypothetical protein